MIYFWTDSNSLAKVEGKSWTVKNIFQSFHFLIPDVLATENNTEDIGAKTDLLKYEIVYKYGGIYSDTDSYSLARFGQEFSNSFVSYSGEPYNNLCASIFGMPKNSNF